MIQYFCLKNGVGKVDNHMQKYKPGSLFYTIHKSHLKMNYKLELRPETIKRLEENTGESSLKLVLAVIIIFFF